MHVALAFAYVLSCCSRGFRGVSGGVSEGFPRGFRGFPRVSAILHTAGTVGIADFEPQKTGGSYPLYNFKRRNKGVAGTPCLLLEFYKHRFLSRGRTWKNFRAGIDRVPLCACVTVLCVCVFVRSCVCVCVCTHTHTHTHTKRIYTHTDLTHVCCHRSQRGKMKTRVAHARLALSFSLAGCDDSTRV